MQVVCVLNRVGLIFSYDLEKLMDWDKEWPRVPVSWLSLWCGADVVTGGHLAGVVSSSFSTVLCFSLPTLQSEKRIAKVNGNHTPSSRGGELSPTSRRRSS